MKINSVKIYFKDMLDELDFAVKCLIGPTLKDNVFELLELKRIKNVKKQIKNGLRLVERERKESAD
jgi:tryptophan 2,3-dioxygenase